MRWTSMLITAGLLAACSSSGEDDPGTAPDAHDAGPTDPGTAGRGVVIFQVSADHVSGTALFSAPSTDPGIDHCTSSEIGPCRVQVCPDPGDVANPPLGSAGTLTITGGSVPVTLTPTPLLDGQYDIADGSDAMFPIGGTATLSASGGDVPAFDGKSLKVPRDIEVTGDYSTIDFDADLEVSWTGGGPDGKVVMQLETNDAGSIGDLTCSFDPAAGSGTVPVAALRAMPGCPGDGVCGWFVVPRSTARFSAGGYAIDFIVQAGGVGGMLQTQ